MLVDGKAELVRGQPLVFGPADQRIVRPPRGPVPAGRGRRLGNLAPGSSFREEDGQLLPVAGHDCLAVLLQAPLVALLLGSLDQRIQESQRPIERVGRDADVERLFMVQREPAIGRPAAASECSGLGDQRVRIIHCRAHYDGLAVAG